MKRILVLGAFGFAAACGKGHVEQCDALIEKVNRVDNSIAHGSGTTKAHCMSDVATFIENASSELRAMQLRDEILRRDRDDYLKTLSRIASYARAMQSALDKQDQPAMRECLERLQTAAQDESAVVERINRDCRLSTAR